MPKPSLAAAAEPEEHTPEPDGSSAEPTHPGHQAMKMMHEALSDGDHAGAYHALGVAMKHHQAEGPHMGHHPHKPSLVGK